MRLAIARTGNDTAQHFGHCDNFVIFDLEDQKVISQNILDNPGHSPGILPPFLAQHGINVVIAGGMGQKARDLFAAHHIETITGLAGSIEQILEAYLNNTLIATNETCSHEGHEHGHNCDHNTGSDVQ